METVEVYRRQCLKRQTELRRSMLSGSQPAKALRLFLQQHAQLHALRMAGTEPWSFEDEVLNDLSPAQIRRVPAGGHSVAWLIWHSARCEDITMNRLVTGRPQVLLQGRWLERLQVTVRDTGNAMSPAEVARFSAAVDLKALRAYRLAVGRRTQAIVKQLASEAWSQPVDPARLQQALAEGAVVEAARGIADYWGRRDLAGLLLMPATRHNLVHLNEAWQLKRKGL